jgi:hypothetical protein
MKITLSGGITLEKFISIYLHFLCYPLLGTCTVTTIYLAYESSEPSELRGVSLGKEITVCFLYLLTHRQDSNCASFSTQPAFKIFAVAS